MIYDDVPCENLDADQDGRGNSPPGVIIFWGREPISQPGKLRHREGSIASNIPILPLQKRLPRGDTLGKHPGLGRVLGLQNPDLLGSLGREKGRHFTEMSQGQSAA